MGDTTGLIMYHNIPLELRLAPRWCFTGTEHDGDMAKAPFHLCPEENRFKPLPIHDYHLCLTFEEIEPLLGDYPERGFGFIMVDGDGFTCVDLDVKPDTPVSTTVRYAALVEAMDTYTEVSRSGAGLHLWLKGEINGAIKTSEMEVYSRERFIICTGNTLHDKPMAYDPATIEFFNERAKESAATFDLADAPQTKTDEEVIDEALASDHSGKLACLMSGDWDSYVAIMRQQGAPDDYVFDASQGDSAFMTIVTYYTRNIEQCKRLWRMSALADVTKRYPHDEKEQRKKARNIGTDYKLLRAIKLAVSRNEADEAQRIALAEEGRRANAALLAKVKQAQEGVREVMEGDIPPIVSELQYPPGVLGDLAKYFYSQSIKPIKEFAIAEALAVAAGLFGRTHNISGTGLNTYLMVLAPSGTGKSALSKNPENLMTMLERGRGVMGARQFIMSKRFTHENAMFQEFKERSSFTQCLSEFGKVFKNMVSLEGAGGALATVRECMTDIYSKSGAFDVAGGMRYATSERSVDLGYPVAYSFLGESVPEPFFESITPDMFTDGFMSRFLLLEFTGDIPYDTFYNAMQPPEQLMSYLEQATVGCVRALLDINKVEVTPVGLDADTGKWFSEFSRSCTDKANLTKDDPVINSLWTRANLKVLKLAGLVATMDNFARPVVNMGHVEWAHDFVMRHNYLVRSSVNSGRMSNASEAEAMEAVRQACIAFYNFKGDCGSYHAKAADMRASGHIPWGWIQRRCIRLACFKGHSFKKPTQVVRDTVEELKRCGTLRQLNPKEVSGLYASNADVYQLLQ